MQPSPRHQRPANVDPSKPWTAYDVTDLSQKREIGSEPGTLWSVSSSKPGHGVKQLRDPDLEKLWQSDGTQPHRINIEFARRTAVTHVSLWLNVKRDDSYTPKKIQIKAGTGWHDLTEVRFREWDKPSEPYQWKHFLLSCGNPRDTRWEEDEHFGPASTDTEADEEGKVVPIHTWMIQIAVLANHQNGKDTHIRGCLVWGPKDDTQEQAATREAADRDDDAVIKASRKPAQADVPSSSSSSAHSVFASLR